MIAATDYFLPDDDSSKSLKSQTIRGGSVMLVSHGVKQAVSIASLVVLGRILAPSDYGLVAMAGVIAGFVALFQDLGLAVATIQQPKISHRQVSTLFWVNLGFSLLLGLAFAVLARPIAQFYDEPRVTTVALLLALGFPLAGAASQHFALLRRVMAFSRIAIVEVAASTMGVSIGIAAAVMGSRGWPQYNYLALVVVSLSTSLFRCAGVWIASGWTPGLPARGSGVRPMIRFGVNITGSGFLTYVCRNLDSLLIGKYFGREVLGVYDRGYALFLAPQRKLLAPMANLFVPPLSRIANDSKRFRKAFLELYEAIAFVAVGVVTAFVCSSDLVVEVLLTKKWEASASYFAALGPLGVAQALSASCYWALTAAGRSHTILRLNLMHFVVCVASIVCALPFGPLAVAYSFMLGGILIREPVTIWCLSKALGIPASALFSRCAAFVAAALAAAAATWTASDLIDIRPAALAMGVKISITLFSYLISLSFFSYGRQVIRRMVVLFQHLSLELRNRRKCDKA